MVRVLEYHRGLLVSCDSSGDNTFLDEWHGSNPYEIKYFVSCFVLIKQIITFMAHYTTMASTTPRFTAAYLLNRLTGGDGGAAQVLRDAADRQQYLTQLSNKGVAIK